MAGSSFFRLMHIYITDKRYSLRVGNQLLIVFISVLALSLPLCASSRCRLRIHSSPLRTVPYSRFLAPGYVLVVVGGRFRPFRLPRPMEVSYAGDDVS